MPDIFAITWNYLQAVLWNWANILFVGIGPLVRGGPMLKKIGCPAAAKSLDGFIKKPAIRRCLVLAAILIFVGVNFSEFYEAKIELAEKERQLANVDEVGACNAKLEWLSQAEGRDAKLDAHKIIRLARITGNPYSVIFEAHGDGLLGLGAKNQDPRRLDIFAGPEQLIPAMSLSLLKFVGQASLVDEAMLPS